jgi:hypothetical protein
VTSQTEFDKDLDVDYTDDGFKETRRSMYKKEQGKPKSNSKVRHGTDQSNNMGSEFGYDSEGSLESEQGWMDINTHRQQEEQKVKTGDNSEQPRMKSPYTSFSS